MSVSFDPDNSTAVVSPWSTVHLSTRDLTAQIPINFVTHPSVSLTKACFGDNIYEDGAAARCFSNLLAMQYRRFQIDVYWDSQSFLLCPVAVLTESSHASASSSVTVTPGNSSSSSTTSSSATPTSITSGPGPSGETMYNLGPYQCTSTLDLSVMITVLLGYIHQSQTTLAANLLYLDVNLHAAASAEGPTRPASAPLETDLPSGSDLIGSKFDNAISEYLYTPEDLETERADLNRSWYSVTASRAPIAEYFTTVVSNTGVQSTPDGWPCEDYVEVAKGARVLLGWGTIDPQMQGYNFSGDSTTMFPPGYLSAPRNFSSSIGGNVTSGCFFNVNKTDVASVNSSFAIARGPQNTASVADATDPMSPLSGLTRNLTLCGISPFVNNTLLNTSASTSPLVYQNISYSSVWSWAEGEPLNNSRPGEDDDDSSNIFRCALMDMTHSYAGRWRVEDCAQHYPVACRVGNSPYSWSISSQPVIFSAAAAACGDDTFDVPRTGLENLYLYARALSLPRDQIDPIDSTGARTGIWMDFNSLDMPACWVKGGPNATCPYFVNPKDVQRREVLIPTIAAIIALIITALTLFVKCNVNRRMSRRKKRGAGGWDYEGVPS